MLNRLYIVDDFYSDPDKLVETALQAAREEKSNGNYGGVMTLESFLSEHQRDFFQKLTMEPSINSATPLNGRIRFTQESDTFRQNIHFDGFAQTRWSGVVYLSRNHPSVEGTVFWKHKRTGLEEMPRTVEGLASFGWTSNQALQQFLETDGVDDSRWEQTFAVPYKYNRLVLFRPWLFHSPGRPFGDSLDSSRLVQTIFLSN